MIGRARCGCKIDFSWISVSVEIFPVTDIRLLTNQIQAHFKNTLPLIEELESPEKLEWP
jgi:hypothetical protein